MKTLGNMCFREKTWLTTKAALTYNRCLKFRCRKRLTKLYKHRRLASLCSSPTSLQSSPPFQPLLGLARQSPCSSSAALEAAQLIPKQYCNTLGSDKALKNSAQPRQLTHCFPGPELSPAAVDRPIANPCQPGACCWRRYLPSLGSVQPSHWVVQILSGQQFHTARRTPLRLCSQPWAGRNCSTEVL